MRTLLIASIFVLIATGCAGGGSDPLPAVATITIAPGELTLTRGESTPLKATLRDGSGKILQGRAVTWSSNDATKAAVTTCLLYTSDAADE